MKKLLSILPVASVLALPLSAAPPPKGPCVSVDVLADAARTPATSFSVSKTIDLVFRAVLAEPVSGDHVAEMRVFTPDGHLYRSLAVPYNDGTREPRSRTLPGYARPVREKAPSRVSVAATKYPAVSGSLPVGGTDVVSSGLYGKWKVEVHIDGAEAPCTSATTFTLVP